MPYTFPKCWLIRLRLARKQIASFFFFPKLLSGIFLLVWCHRGCSICRPNGFSNSSFSRAFERVFYCGRISSVESVLVYCLSTEMIVQQS